LLALGAILASTLAWALIAMPMTLIVVSLLVEQVQLHGSHAAGELDVPDVAPTVIVRRVAAPPRPAAPRTGVAARR
jgi:hypothetical protein